ncbi:MAG TPA: hypothetical protein PKD53_12565, partial [Chloroflexaceae bacterium]|nr:hypothetical protein [Chloroflexaceae bacterium]
MSHHEPTIASILRALAGEYDGPVEERRVLERVLEQRPSSAKNPYATIRERLRWDGLTLGWLRISRAQLMPLRVALQGLRFRCLPRPRDVEAGLLPLVHLQPFAGLRSYACAVRDDAGAPMALVEHEAEAPRDAALPAFDLAAWYARTGFQPGDSIAVTVASAEPLAMRIEREPRESFRAAAVADQDAALLEAVVERVRRSQAAIIPCDEVILPVFATAPWRAAYPGSPWQHLIMADGRLQLVDDIFLTSQRLASLHLFGSDDDFEAVAAGHQHGTDPLRLRSHGGTDLRNQDRVGGEAAAGAFRPHDQVDRACGDRPGQLHVPLPGAHPFVDTALPRARRGSLDDRH